MDAATFGVTPSHNWPMHARVSMAVINLNPFTHTNRVTVVAEPFKPDAPSDRVVLPLAKPAPRPIVAAGVDSLSPFLPPCAIPDLVRNRLRTTFVHLHSARLAVSSWIGDSLERPLTDVRDRRFELKAILDRDEEQAKALFDAAWRLHELVKTAVPAIRRSGLLDSTRIVPLSNVLRPFEADVQNITGCSDPELASWQSEVQLTNGELRHARQTLGAEFETLTALENDDNDTWSVASNPRNFYYYQVIGEYSQAMNVFVRLFRFDRNERLPVRLDPDSNLTAMWTLVFK